MTIELLDIDNPYKVEADCNDECMSFIRIHPRCDLNDETEDYDICLNRDLCLELARVLNFLANEIK